MAKITLLLPTFHFIATAGSKLLSPLSGFTAIAASYVCASLICSPHSVLNTAARVRLWNQNLGHSAPLLKLCSAQSPCMVHSALYDQFTLSLTSHWPAYCFVCFSVHRFLGSPSIVLPKNIRTCSPPAWNTPRPRTCMINFLTSFRCLSAVNEAYLATLKSQNKPTHTFWHSWSPFSCFIPLLHNTELPSMCCRIYLLITHIVYYLSPAIT